jgi:plastocyanin
MQVRLVVIVTLLGVLSTTGCSQSPQESRPQPKRHTVLIEGMAFRPAAMTVSAGDSVVWINKDLVPHAAATEGAGFDSKVLGFNESFTHVFAASGDFEYVCPFHPTMRGHVQVR